MTTAATECAHCHMPISDPTSEVRRGNETFCCPNCAAATEHDATASRGARCAQCGVPIVDRSTVVTRAAETFCCANCLNAMDSFAGPSPRAADSGSARGSL